MMRIRLFIVLLFVCAGQFKISAQEIQEEGFQEVDTLKMINQDPRVDSLILLHRKALEVNLAHEEHDGIIGYRIQIFFESGNNSKNRAIWVKNQFDGRYPQVPSYIIFGEPYYRVRVGDFRTRIEADAFKKRIVRRYSNAFVIEDKIKFPKLLNN